MKNPRIIIVGATLLLAGLAGTASAGDLPRQVGCQVDAVAHYLGNQPAPAGETCGG